MKRICIVLILLGAAWIYYLPAQESAQFSYVGNKSCFKCHIKQFKSWEETKMAKAYELLKPGQRSKEKQAAGLDPNKDYSQDPECLPCHTTGYGKPGGFVDLQSSPQLAGVGCEVCHGAGAEYTKDEYMSLKNKDYKRAEVVKVGLVSPVTEKVCVECHNKKSPFFKEFDFQARKAQGIHTTSPLRFKHE